MFLVTAAEMQAMDRNTIEFFGIPGRILMENAGRGATAHFLETILKATDRNGIAVAAGRGNNGGDGFVMARYLAQLGLPVHVYLLAPRSRVQGDAAANLDLLQPLNVPVTEIQDPSTLTAASDRLQRHDIWIDALLGTGLTSPVRGIYQQMIDTLNAWGKPVFAVDIPSGVDSDTGRIRGTAIQAHATATFGFAKCGHLQYPGAALSGRLRIIEIGIPPHIARKIGCQQHLITSWTVQKALPARAPDAHKGHAGHLLVVAGSVGKSGAALMTAMAAARTGTGLVTLGLPVGLNRVVEDKALEVMSLPLPETVRGSLSEAALEPILAACQGKSCLALGPGLGTEEATKQLVLKIITETRLPLVIDADGLNNVVGELDLLKERSGEIILTPHPGEMARLCRTSTKEIQQDRIARARQLAVQYGIHLVLKGAGSVVAHPNGEIFINPTGNAGMATGGMGDVLTGIIAGCICIGCSAQDAANIGVFLHGLAADQVQQSMGPYGYLASDVIAALPGTLRTVLNDAPRSGPELDRLFYQH